MANPRIRINEGSDPQPQLLWDSVWNVAAGFADWAVASATEIYNRGGLRARATLSTAIVLQLFTDRRLPADHPLRKYVDDDDLRGWWGDGVDVRVDLHEDELGSWLWALSRAPLNEDTRRWTETLALSALQTLVDQGIAARITTQAIMEPAIGRMDLLVRVYRSDGSLAADRRFDDIWNQLGASDGISYAPPVPPPGGGGLDFSDPDNSQYLPGLV